MCLCVSFLEFEPVGSPRLDLGFTEANSEEGRGDQSGRLLSDPVTAPGETGQVSKRRKGASGPAPRTGPFVMTCMSSRFGDCIGGAGPVIGFHRTEPPAWSAVSFLLPGRCGRPTFFTAVFNTFTAAIKESWINNLQMAKLALGKSRLISAK